jgi:hypothetical protein
MVLKGRNHPTWQKTIQAEIDLGNSVVKGEDGRYYSVRMPKYLSKIRPVGQDTAEEAGERADRDFNLSVETGIPLTVWQNSSRSIKTGRWKHNIPFVGDVFQMRGLLEVAAAAERLQGYPQLGGYDSVFEKQMWTFGKEEEHLIKRYGEQFVSPEDIPAYEFPLRPVRFNKGKDEKLVAEYIKYISQDKDFGAKLGSGVIALPKWMVEFAVTGGLASMGDDAAVKAGEKLLKSYAKTKVGALAIKTASWSSGAVTRSFGLSSKVTAGFAQQDLDEILGLKEETGWATKLARSWGDVVIESASESFAGKGGMSEAILQGLPFGKAMTEGLEKTWIAVTGGSKGEFIRKMSTKAGYSNILGELGEERVGTILRAVTDVDHFGAGEDATMLERLKYGAIQDIENIWVEIGVLSVPMAGQMAAGRLINIDKMTRIREQTMPELVEKEQQEADLREQINKEIDKSAVEEPAEETADKPVDVIPEAEKTEEVTEKPHTTISEANYSEEVDDVTSQILTNRANPSLTSLKQEDIELGREILGLGSVPSVGRKTWQATLQQSKDEGYENEAERIASEVNSGSKEGTTDVEAAGMLIKSAQLLIEHKVESRNLEKATEPTAIAMIRTKLDRIQDRFDSLSAAMHKAGSIAGRRLNMQKMTIDKDYSLVSVKSRAKARRGKPLTQKQNDKLEELVSELEQSQRDIKRLQDEVAELTANQFMKLGKTSRYKQMDNSSREIELDSLLSKTKQLLDEGC